MSEEQAGLLADDQPKRRGRPPKVRSDEPQARRRRKGRGKMNFGLNLQLEVPIPEPEGVKFRWFTSEEVAYNTVEDDWEPVKIDGIPYTVTGSQGTESHLLQKRRDWYESDYAEEQARIVEVSKGREGLGDVGTGGTPDNPNPQGFYNRPGHTADEMIR